MIGRTPKRVLRTPPTPLRIDARRVVAIGTALWFLAALVLLACWPWLHRHDHLSWIWTCLVGGGLGLAGLALMSRHRGEGRL